MSLGEVRIDYERFRRSLRRLGAQHEIFARGDPYWSVNVQEAMAESVVRRFETCYDCLWRVLRRYLILELGIPSVPNSPKPVFRLAAENLVLRTPIEQWIKYANARIDTSHDYDGEKAQACLLVVPAFIADSIQLYVSMSRGEWD